MRVILNVMIFAILEVGVALPLWAAFRWNLSTPIALTVVLLAWAYCLALVRLAVTAAREDEKTEAVRLDRGLLESIEEGSEDLIGIGLLIDKTKIKFNAHVGVLGQLAQGDSVLFAYIRYRREIIGIVGIDESTPGRISRSSEEQKRAHSELMNGLLRGILTRKALHTQATFAALLPGTLGALTIAIVGGLLWDLGWVVFVLLVVAGIWLILVFIVASVEQNYENIAKLKLDIGYVMEEEHHVNDDSGGASQRIVIAETPPPNGMNPRKHEYLQTPQFRVRVGDLVMLATGANGRIALLRSESER